MDALTTCSFCGDSDRTAGPLFAGFGARICVACVEHAYVNRRADGQAGGRPYGRTPAQLLAALRRHVVGQDHAARILAVAVYNHYKRVSGAVPGVGKSNVLMVGPTGSGKTLMARTLATELDVPFVVVDVTRLTQAGYAGEDVDTILLQLLAAADGDVARAQRGIVFLDEIDKLARRGAAAGLRTLDVGGEGVQQSLLKLVEGTTVEVSVRGARPDATVALSTRDVLFVGGGAFVELDEIRSARLRRTALGFRAGPAGEARRPGLPGASPDDLVEYGLLPELVGRIPVVCELQQLDAGHLRRVLTEPADALVPEYRTLLALDGVDLRLDDDALDAVAEQAVELGMGARSLRAILEEVLLPLMFDAPALGAGSAVRVTRADVEQRHERALGSAADARAGREEGGAGEAADDGAALLRATKRRYG